MSCPLDGIASLHPKFGTFVPILTFFEANNGFNVTQNANKHVHHRECGEQDEEEKDAHSEIAIE